MELPIADILATEPTLPTSGEEIGASREARPIVAYRLGHGRIRVSVIGGCHADEPVGPRLLRQLVAYLSERPPDDPLLTHCEWWIVPHINPDGEAKNQAWYGEHDPIYDIAAYLRNVVREAPGDDLEFGFPRNAGDRGARPESQAVYRWWHEAPGPFHLHVTLHGMGFAAGPWFLVEPGWKDRMEPLRQRCVARVKALGYELHDVERNGEKGFVRLARGFCTRPNSRSMRDFFLERHDPETAAHFRPSSMETIRSFGGDPLTLVSEMPLFLTPRVGETLGPPDPVAEVWKTRIAGWRRRLAEGAAPDSIRADAIGADLSAMPIADQMDLQATLIAAGITLVGGVAST